MLKDIIYKKGKTVFPYIEYLPDNYSKKKKHPLVLFLHGAGERGTDFEHYKFGLPKTLKNGYAPDAVILCPQCPKDYTWTYFTRELRAFIDDMVKKYNIDTTRLSITGLSMGGFGTWEMIQCYPDLFAAAGPICGGGMAWRCEVIKTPLRAYHGTADTCVLPIYSQMMVDVCKRHGVDARLTLLEGYTHNSWDYAYEQDHLIEWLLSHKK